MNNVPKEDTEKKNTEATPSENGVKKEKKDSAAPIDAKKEMEKKRRKKKLKKNIIRIVILLVIAGTIFGVIQFFNKKQEAETEKTQTYTVKKRTITSSLTGSGTLEPTNRYTVSALVKGEVLEANFNEGDIVQEDSLLYRIDSSNLDSSIERAQLSVERAQNSYDELLENLEDLTVSSDYSGIIQKFNLEVGDKIGQNTVIAQVIDKDTMTCEASFFAEDADKFSVGEAAVLYFDDGAQTLEGTVDEISALSTVNTYGSRVRGVKIKVHNPGGLTDASFATASVNGVACFEGGYFTYNTSENIISTASGEIEKIYIQEGKWVNKGDIVLVLDSTSIKTQIKNSEISLKDAKSSLQSAIDQKDDYDITAPISGTVISKNYEAGEVIDSTSGNTLAEIYDMSALKFTMNIDELDIANIAVGQGVSITSDAYEGKKFTGEITKISIQGSSSNGTTSYPVTVMLSEVGELLPGMNVDAEIIIQQKQDTIAVPTNAIARGNRVKVVVKDGSASEGEKASSEGERVSSEGEKIPSEGDKAVSSENASAEKKTNTSEGGFTPASGEGTNREGNANTVLTMPDGVKYKEVTVELGINDDDYVEVLSGLNEGDEVIVTELTLTNRTAMEAMMMGGMGGAPMGGGNMGGGNMGGGNMGGGQNMGGGGNR